VLCGELFEGGTGVFGGFVVGEEQVEELLGGLLEGGGVGGGLELGVEVYGDGFIGGGGGGGLGWLRAFFRLLGFGEAIELIGQAEQMPTFLDKLR
jgi:hypothetical protein